MRGILAAISALLICCHAWALPIGGTPLPVGGLPAVTLTTGLAGTNTLPFTIGQTFPQGTVTGPVHLAGISSSSCTVMQTWPDGSDKHAICGGRASITAGTQTTAAFAAGSGSAAAALTCASIQTANPSASVTISTASPSVITLASVIANPIRAWAPNSERIECDYKATSSIGALVYFYVTLYADGRVYVRETVDNGWVDQDLGNLAFTLTGTVGGTNVYGPTAITLFHYTRWTTTGWIGGDPQITPQHDTNYLISTKLVPNYFMDAVPTATLNGLYQTYTYATAGDGDANEPGTGAQFQIGLLPGWEAVYITSLADSRAYKALLANGAQEFSFPILFRGHADSDLIVRPSQWGTTNCPGSSGGSSDGCAFVTPATPTNLTWDVCHSDGGGYLPYMVTGEYFFAELLQTKAAVAYLADGAGFGTGVNRSVFHTAVRCPAWEMRTMALEAALVPNTDPVTADIQARLAANASLAATAATQAGLNNLGIFYEYDLFGGGSSGTPFCHGSSGFEATCSLFMEFFMAQTFGFVSDIAPFASAGDLTNWNVTRNYQDTKLIVPLVGSLSGTDFCYSYAAGTFDYTYNATQDLHSVTDANFAANFGAVYNLSAATKGNPCTNTLQGSSGSDPANGATTFWANYLPALSLAVDHAVSGAQAGLNRLIGASNYSSFRQSTANPFSSQPQFGIQPRGQRI